MPACAAETGRRRLPDSLGRPSAGRTRPAPDRLRAALLVGALGLSLWAPRAAMAADGAAADLDLPQLTALLAQVKSGEATFTEKRQVAMLDKPLVSTGRLSFDAPDTFVREQLTPRPEKISVVGNRVTMSQGSRSRSVALDSIPEVSLIVEAIRGTLTGNREALEHNFAATVGGDRQRWSLELVPREAALRQKVSAVRLNGRQSLVREVQVTMADGDSSLMTIEPITAVPPALPAPGAGPGLPASSSR